MPASAPTRRWSASSLALIFAAWAILQLGGIFTPGLLDDVDSIYLQVAREMLQRHDFVTPTIDGIRFFDKPPLMYWMAAGSMRIFGVHDWAARLPLAIGVLALLLAVYALGIRFYTAVSPASHPDRGGLYAALAVATSLGPYLYTRFYIPDILIGLWMAISIHLFLIAINRLTQGDPSGRGALAPCLGFGAVTALSLLTKGLIGVVFPLAFVLLYLLITRNLGLLPRLHPISSTLVFLAIGAPWHILAAIRNPPVAMPRGVGLPARAGWAWFYLYNEHIARFLGRRIPHDYGQVPVPLFWLLLALWLFPWVAFLPSALIDAMRSLRSRTEDTNLRFDSDADFVHSPQTHLSPSAQMHEAALSCILWASIILGFFTLSSRQEYYHLPALPALALLVGGLLAAADAQISAPAFIQTSAIRSALRGSLFLLVPVGSFLFVLCGYFALTAPSPQPGITLNDVLSPNPALYNLSLGHVFDLTGRAMGFFRGPLLTVGLCMLVLGPIAYLVRRGAAPSRPRRAFFSNLLIAAAMIGVLLAAHEGLVRFYPILGSKDLALKIDAQLRPGDLVILDGELTSGSTLLFYTPRSAAPVLLVHGRVNGPWFGSFWPGAPDIFPGNARLDQLWAGPKRVFLLTYHAQRRSADLARIAPVYVFANSGGKTILTNRPAPAQGGPAHGF